MAVDHTDPSLPEDLRELADEADPVAGFFGPGSVKWRVARERTLRLSGVSAILLQLAHPKVAAGVDEHSQFDVDPVGRFERTFELVDAIIFGDRARALQGALEIRRVHERVTGALEESVGPYAAGARYDATDPALLLWVQATLIDQSLSAYETYVGHLSQTEKEAFYRDSKTFGRLVGIPADQFPDDLTDFYEYYETTIDENIAVGEGGMALKRTLFDQGRSSYRLFEFFGATTLPPRVRRAYDLPWNRRRTTLFEILSGTVGLVVPALPDRLRFIPAYRTARRRVKTTTTE